MKNNLIKILLILFLSTGLMSFVIYNLKDNIVYFYTPSELYEKYDEENKTVRIGGVVLNKSVKYQGDNVSFLITDFKNQIKVVYKGVLPSLFREGQGVVAIGNIIKTKGYYVLDSFEILAKHDEQYMTKQEYEKIKNTYKENK